MINVKDNWLPIASIIFVAGSLFYEVTANSEEIDKLSTLLRTIDTRLSRIEGALGVSQGPALWPDP